MYIQAEVRTYTPSRRWVLASGILHDPRCLDGSFCAIAFVNLRRHFMLTLIQESLEFLHQLLGFLAARKDIEAAYLLSV